MDKLRFAVYIFVAVIGMGFACAFAAPAMIDNPKVVFKVSDAEIKAFLEKAKTSSPGLYDTLMHFKDTDMRQFDLAICSAIAQERLKNSGGLLEQTQKAQTDTLKVMYNISEQEISSFLSGLKTANAAEYDSLMHLKSGNPSAYEASVLSRVINYRKTRSYSPAEGTAGASTDKLAIISAEIAQKSAEVQKAQNPAAKQKLTAELKALMTKSYDLSTSLLTEQANLQASTMNKLIEDRKKDKDKNIDAWFNQVTAQPAR